MHLPNTDRGASRAIWAVASIFVGTLTASGVLAQPAPVLTLETDGGSNFIFDSFERLSTNSGPLADTALYNDSETDTIIVPGDPPTSFDVTNTWGGRAFAEGGVGESGNYFRVRASSRTSGGIPGPRNSDRARASVFFRDTIRVNGPGGAPRNQAVDVTFRTEWITNLDFGGANGLIVDPEAEASYSVGLIVYGQDGSAKDSVQTGIQGRIYDRFVNKSTREIFIDGFSGLEANTDTITVTLDPGDSIGLTLNLDVSADPARFGIGADPNSGVDDFGVDAFGDNILKIWAEGIAPTGGNSSLTASQQQGQQLNGYELSSSYGIDYTVVDPVPSPAGALVAGPALLACARRRRR